MSYPIEHCSEGVLQRLKGQFEYASPRLQHRVYQPEACRNWLSSFTGCFQSSIYGSHSYLARRQDCAVHFQQVFCRGKQILQPKREVVQAEAGWGYKTYFYGPSRGGKGSSGSISVRVSANMLEGSTGCYQWEAGFLLGGFILSHPDLFAGEVVDCRQDRMADAVSCCSDYSVHRMGVSYRMHAILKRKLQHIGRFFN